MRIAVTGSLAYDYIMNFPGQFKDHILPEKVHMLTVSFLVDSMKKLRGGTAGNIAYTLALLGEKPLVVSAAGADFHEYRQFMTRVGIDSSGIKEIPAEFTASCFINTDQSNNQIVAFYPGAVAHGREVSLEGLGLSKNDWAVISPTDPESMQRHTEECQRLGVNYIFDPGKQTPRLNAEQIRAGLKGCAALIGNDYEFAMMSKALGISEEQLIQSAPLTVMTRGEQGSTFYDQKAGNKTDIGVAHPVQLVDPTGAGDAYLGALLFGLSRKLKHETTGKIAALAATYCIEKKGCQEHEYSLEAFKDRYQTVFGSRLEM